MFKKTRTHIRRFFYDTCTIKNTKVVYDAFGGAHSEDVVICENEPCRLSFIDYSTFKTTENTNEGISTIKQIIKLFLREDLEIPIGSKIVVIKNGKELFYRNSGGASLHSNHQELNLEIDQSYA